MLFDCCFQRRQWLAALSLLCVAVGTCHTHAAKDGRLSVDLAPSSPPVRANAPLQVLLKVYWNDDTIVEGNFEATLLADGQTRVAECTSGDLVLTPGGQLIRLTMPTTGSNVSFGQDQIGLKFVTAEKVIDLQPILLPGRSGTRRFSICLITPNAATASDVEAEFRTSMRLGSILQGVTDTSRAPTSTVYWERDDVPEQSILFCSFDVVVLSPQGFSALRQRQLQALRQWVRAGGSVCVMLPSSLDSHQSEFLNDLVSEATPNAFALYTSGQLIVDQSGARNGIWLANRELGRVAIVSLDNVPQAANRLWKETRRTSAFLWKLKSHTAQQALRFKRDEVEAAAKRKTEEYRNRRNYDPITWRPLQSTGQLMSRLVPEDVEVVPMSLVGLILLMYLALIGPGDYLGLGALRMRKYTWVTFPATTALIAFLCVTLSDIYLSSKTTGKTLVIRDMDADGDPLRESRFQMLFKSRRAEVETELKNHIFTPLDQERLTLNVHYAYQAQYAGANSSSSGTRPRYRGRMPEQYVVTQTIAQWRPQINRTLTLETDEIAPTGFDWKKAETLLHADGHRDLGQLIRETWPNASAFLLRGSQRYQICGSFAFTNPEFNHNDYRYYQYREQFGNQVPNMFLYELCARDGNGLFEFVSQTAPSGGDNFEDITLLDTTNLKHALLVIVVEQGQEIILHRRLYTGLE